VRASGASRRRMRAGGPGRRPVRARRTWKAASQLSRPAPMVSWKVVRQAVMWPGEGRGRGHGGAEVFGGPGSRCSGSGRRPGWAGGWGPSPLHPPLPLTSAPGPPTWPRDVDHEVAPRLAVVDGLPRGRARRRGPQPAPGSRPLPPRAAAGPAAAAGATFLRCARRRRASPADGQPRSAPSPSPPPPPPRPPTFWLYLR
jgi:hypothetical protein